MASAKRTGVRRVVPAKACEIDLHARKLDLKAKELGDIGTAALLGAISGGNTPNLREVVLTQNKLTDAVMEPLAAAVASHGLEGLKGLSLAENSIGASGIARLVISMVGRDELAELSELSELRHHLFGLQPLPPNFAVGPTITPDELQVLSGAVAEAIFGLDVEQEVTYSG